MTGKTTPQLTSHWDAGDAGCSALIIGISRAIGAIEPGTQIEVRARNAGAPRDLPAWCRLTGHRLIEIDHPRYVLVKKGD